MNRQRKRKSSNAHMILPVLALCGVALGFQMRWVSHNQEKFAEPHMANLVRQMNPIVNVKIMCPLCNGTGEMMEDPESGTGKIACPLSFGMGYNEILIDPRVQAICHACGGMGAQLEGDPAAPMPCLTCQSRGVLEASNPFRLMTGPIYTFIFECHHCNTQGQLYDSELDIKVECPICQGRGQRQTRAMHGVDQSCPNCAGMGRWINPDTDLPEPCPRCGGQGLVTELSDES